MNDKEIGGIFILIMFILVIISFADTAITHDIPCWMDENAYCRE